MNMIKIYRIVDNTNGNIYIGKTTRTLKERLKEHETKRSKSMSRYIIKNGDYRIELIEETDDINRERYWILNTECINKNIPGIVNPDIKKIIKIYKIIDNTNGNIYIGKTIQTLKRRLHHHKSHKECVSREIIKNGDYKIELIEETFDTSRERYWVENTECINKKIQGRTGKEYRETNKERMKQLYKEYHIEYRENNREHNKEYAKQYRIKNKELVNKKDRDRRQYKNSWGGDPRFNNNLLKIDPNLFF